MSNQRRRNQETKAEIHLDIPGTLRNRSVRITGTIHNQFAVPGVWLRGSLHCHLGRPNRPEWLAGAVEHYRGLGYDFIAGMEHNRIIAVDSQPDILVIPGAEMSGPGHVLVYGMDQLPEPDQAGDEAERTAGMIRKIRERGGIAVLAHPFKSGYTWEQLSLLCDAGLDGIEVLNSNVRGKGADTGRADQIWHQLLRDGRSLIALGSDDAHGPHEDMAKSAWGGVSHIGWTGVLADEFSVAAVLEAIRKGRTYASEGPEIRAIEFRDDGKLTVSCSPCVGCHFRSVGGGRGGSSVFPPEGQAFGERFVFDLAVAGYRVQDRLVIVLQDAFGRRAWVSPIRVDLTIQEVP